VTESEDDNQLYPAQEGGRVERIMRALELTQGVEIARRYLAMNAFDGALTMLGLILGGLFTINPLDPIPGFNAIFLAAAGTNIAMAISGFSGSYLAESAERDREVDEMGRAMLTDMSKSMYVGTRKMVNYARVGRSQGKLWWRTVAILTCKSIVKLGYRGERLIEPSSSWFPPKFPSG